MSDRNSLQDELEVSEIPKTARPMVKLAGLVLMGLLLRQARLATRTVALLTLPLFLLDAWFDILSSVTPHHLAIAITMAAVSEVPAAVVCGWVAWKASHFAAAPVGGLRGADELAR